MSYFKYKQTQKNKTAPKLFKSVKATLNPNAAKTIATKNYVNKAIKKAEEPKHHDLSDSKDTIWDAAPINLHISGIPQSAGASTDQTRVGDKVKISAINIRMKVNLRISETPSDNAQTANWRVMVVQDRNYNTSTTGVAPVAGGATVTLNQLLINGPEGFGPSILSQRNVDHLQNLVVLYDKTFSTQFFNVPNKFINIKPNMKYCKREIQFSNGSNITNVTNGIYLLVFSDSEPTPALDALVYFQSRVLFRDA